MTALGAGRPAEPPVVADDRAPLLRLVQRMRGRGFSAAAIVSPAGDAARRLRAWLESAVPELAGRVAAIDVSQPDSHYLPDRLAAEVAAGAQAVVFEGFESARTAAEATKSEGVFRRLNVQRDAIARTTPCFLALVVHPATVMLLRKIAPDFCDFVSLWCHDETQAPSAAPNASAALDLRATPVIAGLKERFAHPRLGEAMVAAASWRLDEARDLLARFDLSGETVPAGERDVVAGVIRFFDGGTAAAADRLQDAIFQLERRSAELNDGLARGLLAIARVFRGHALLRLGFRAEATALGAAALHEVAVQDLAGRLAATDLLVDLAMARGELDEALQLLRAGQLPLAGRLGDDREKAIAIGKVADILEARGELNEALRIRREEELPVYERVGDMRSKAVTMGQIADNLRARGELDEALRIRREEELPVYERLGDVREKAVTLGKVADILRARGELDEALRILTKEVSPAFERLGDVRSNAVTMGKVADILFARGELDEALRILRDEQLPVYERLGDVRSLLVCRANMSSVLLQRNKPGDRAEAQRLLTLALAEAERLKIPEAQRIRAIQRQNGLT